MSCCPSYLDSYIRISLPFVNPTFFMWILFDIFRAFLSFFVFVAFISSYLPNFSPVEQIKEAKTYACGLCIKKDCRKFRCQVKLFVAWYPILSVPWSGCRKLTQLSDSSIFEHFREEGVIRSLVQVYLSTFVRRALSDLLFRYI